MWVNADVFMRLVQTVTKLETKVSQLETKVETLEKRPIIVETKGKDEDFDPEVVLDELWNGRKNEQGRVVYTDGRK
ncbi:MAG: hypothetical protein IJX30_00595 [Clostridia bacterium]|nr:hypothetical protein [Clostridia bacterium]